jgi:HEAT repeat protein
VEGLSYVGTDETIAPLLQTLHDDPSPMVRERSACALAQCGMLTRQQRQTIVPKLIEFAEDTSLDAQTHSNVYHALRDITAEPLPEDPTAWRKWYSSSNRS